MGKPVVCPRCGHVVKLRGGWFGGPGGLDAGMRMMPGNAVIRCSACGHVFALPEDAPLSKQPYVLVVVGVVIALVLALLLLVILGTA